MRSFAIFLGLIALGLLGIAVLAYPAWELTQSLGLDFKFHRVASRIAMLTLLVGFVLVARRLRNRFDCCRHVALHAADRLQAW